MVVCIVPISLFVQNVTLDTFLILVTNARHVKSIVGIVNLHQIVRNA